MLSPDQLKGYADIAVSLLGAGGLGAIVLAAIGIKKATGERPVEDRPSIGHPGLVGIAGMVAGEHFGMELLQRSAEIRDGLRALVVELENGRRTRRETEDEKRTSIRRLCEEIDSLTDATKDRRAT